MKLVLTMIGKDKPGLVEAVSETALAHGANWEASRMAHLAGRFAGMLLVTVPDEEVEALEGALHQLEGKGLRVLVERADGGEAEGGRRLKLDLVGLDRQGIMAKVSSVLARHAINVEELNTSCEAAPMSGGTLFKLQASLHAPSDLDEAALRGDLEQFANELMVDIDLGDDVPS